MERMELGRIGESLAAVYLEQRGWRIVERNVRFREGEIDIVAARAGVLAFVEVKTRRSVAAWRIAITTWAPSSCSSGEPMKPPLGIERRFASSPISSKLTSG